MKLAIITLFSAAVFSAQPIYAANNTIHIATEGAYKPWSFVNGKGNLDGFEIDFVNALCSRIKANCKITAQNWDGLIPSLNSGKFDAIVAAMSITPKRQKVISFSEAYAASPNTFMVLKEGPLSDMNSTGKTINLVGNKVKVAKELALLSKQLKGKTIGVQGSTTASSFVHNKLKGVNVREYKTFDDSELDLLAGRIDAIIANITVLNDSLTRKDAKIAKISGPILQGAPFNSVAIGLRKDDAQLKSRLNSGIKSLREDGTIKKLSEKWFGVDITPKS
ncbi:transporter substrate-binding domain-containing protein [Celerinatantimonas sp. MCCC 1A17872]|uniref:transporter substrate-binding domain-containing protein n=1 Tax=Celerinatantimonas sp. MCCC 1A17872 TaxID=3177514 RepID=UPI0038C40597